MKKFSLITLMLVLILTLCSCTKEKEPEPEPEIDWASKTIDYIEEDTETTSITYEYDEFNISLINIWVYYTDQTSRKIPVTEDMLNETDLNKFNGIGNRRITVYYDDFELLLTLHFKDSSLLDIDLNLEGLYGTVVKAIRNKTSDKIDFIIENSDGVTSLQLKYLFDSSIMQLSNLSLNSSLSGLCEYKIENGELIVTVILDKQVTTETTIFSVEFTGDFRTSTLRIDESFNNILYGFDEEYNSYTIKNVLYHVSVK